MPNGPDSPERLADLLSQYLKRTGMDARIKQSAVLEEWPVLVGPEIAGATKALSITDEISALLDMEVERLLPSTEFGA